MTVLDEVIHVRLSLNILNWLLTTRHPSSLSFCCNSSFIDFFFERQINIFMQTKMLICAFLLTV